MHVLQKFVYYILMRNSLHKRYQINNSKVISASSKAFQKQNLPKDIDINLRGKKDSSGSQKDEQQYFNNPPQRTKQQASRNPSSIGISKHMTTVEQKRKTLQKYKYINQLARMEYEDKQDEVHTKFTRQSKATISKKIMAKNQIAEFIQEEQDENIGYDQLLEFKYGKDKSANYHFQRQQILEYVFCQLCDSVHNDHIQAHTVICERKRKEEPESYSPYSQNYKRQSLYRIKLVVQKIKSPEFQQLTHYLSQLQTVASQSKSIFVQKKVLIFQQMKQLKRSYTNDSIFTMIITKVCNLMQGL